MRAFGDGTARASLSPSRKLKPAKPPRGIGMITAEFSPNISESGLARIIEIKIKPDDINMNELSAWQEKAKQNQLSNAMKKYILWLENCLENDSEFINNLAKSFEEHRKDFRDELDNREIKYHDRIPEACAFLLTSFYYFTKFLTTENFEVESLGVQFYEILLNLAENQSESLVSSSQGELFCQNISAMIESEVVIIPIKESFISLQNDCIGFQDDDFYYLNMESTMKLSWSEVDLQGSSIKIVKTLNRLATKDKTSANKTEIVLDTPKSKNSKRIIPLPPTAVNELKQWKQIQKNDAIIAGSAYEDSGFVVTNELGKYIEPRTMKDHYDRMLKELNCGHFTFHALRHTFATRALEQGMDSKTLSMILGHFSVSFTLDTYAHCLDEHKRKGMALMENIYNAPTDMDEDLLSYPLIFTPIDDGFILLCEDFPKLNQKCASIEQGLEQAKIKLKQIIKQYKYPPAPTKTEDLGIPIGSFMVMLAA